jgi:hypothetical protein
MYFLEVTLSNMKKLSFVLGMLLIGLTSNVLKAQWVQTNGPYGGLVGSFAVSGRNLFAGTQGGGIFLSTNNGTSWIEVNTGMTSTGCSAFAVSGTNLFAGTEGGVFLSTNNGTKWTPVNTGLTNKDVWALTVSGTNLFAGIRGGGVWRLPISDNVNAAKGVK